MADYMGGSDAAKRAWMLNLVAKLTADPGAYMVGSGDVAAVTLAVNSFASALSVVETPDGKTKTNVASKNDYRAAAQAICRQYARMIKYNMGIDDEAKIAAGIVPPTTAPAESRECPISAPGLTIVAATNGAQTVQFSNPLDPTARRKPIGADGVILFRAITEDEPAADISQAQFYRKFTTNPMAVFFDGA